MQKAPGRGMRGWKPQEAKVTGKPSPEERKPTARFGWPWVLLVCFILRGAFFGGADGMDLGLHRCKNILLINRLQRGE